MQGDRVFEAYLRSRRIAYLSVDEARRTLLPSQDAAAPKSFDFLVPGRRGNLLIDVKARRATPTGALPNWVTRDDVESLPLWRAMLGARFEPAFVFVYHCAAAFPPARFEESFACGGLHYGLRAARVEDYRAHMRTRSPRWGTVDVAAATFERISGAFCPAGDQAGDGGGGAKRELAVSAA